MERTWTSKDNHGLTLMKGLHGLVQSRIKRG